MLNLHFKNTGIWISDVYVRWESLDPSHLPFVSLVFQTESWRWGRVLQYSEGSSVAISKLSGTLEWDQCYFSLAEGLQCWVLSFSAKRDLLLVWGQQKWFHDFGLMWGPRWCTDTVSNKCICPVGFSAECVAALPLARLAHAWRRMESFAAGWMSMHNVISLLPDLGSQNFGAMDMSRMREEKKEWGTKKNVAKTHQKESKRPSYAVAAHGCMYPKYSLKMHRF